MRVPAWRSARLRALALREAFDERRGEQWTERASHIRQGSTVGEATLSTPRAARAARPAPTPTPTLRNLTRPRVVLALHGRRDAVRIGPGSMAGGQPDGTSAVVVAFALRSHVLDVGMRLACRLADMGGASGAFRLLQSSGLLRQEPSHLGQHP